MESFQMTSAAKPVGGPLYSAEALRCCEGGSNIQRLTLNPQKAKKRPWPLQRLIATFTNSEIGPSHSKHWTSLFSNRNKNAHSGFHIYSMTLYSEPAERVTGHGLSNRNKVRIEFAVTLSKQRIDSNSNRNKSRGPRISSPTVLEAPGEFSTAR